MKNLVIFVLLIFIRKNVVVKQVAETKIVAPAPTNAQGVQGGPLGGGGVQERPWGPAGGSLIRNAVAILTTLHLQSGDSTILFRDLLTFR